MDFITATAAPVPVRINGKQYAVPRFLMPQLAEWGVAKVQEQLDKALAGLDAEQRARVMMYWQTPPVDVLTLIQELRTPAGIEHLLRTQLAKVGVPAGDIDGMLTYADPLNLRQLALTVSSSDHAAAQLAAESGEPAPGDDPAKNSTGGSPRTSGGPQGIGHTSEAGSPPATPESTRAA